LSNHVSIVMYHYVRELENSRYPNIKGLDYGMFKEQISFLSTNFNIITMEELIAAYDESYNLPEKSVLLTFDDGYIDHFNYVFPLLNELNIQGSFFPPGKTLVENVLLDVNKIHFILASADISTLMNALFDELNYYRHEGYDLLDNEELFKMHAKGTRFDSKEVIFFKRILQTVLPENLRNQISSRIFAKYVGLSESKFSRELYLNHDQLRCMKKCGMYIGIHGYDHYRLANMEKNGAHLDIARALDTLGDLVDSSNWVMCYPYGSANEDVIEILKNSNCRLALTTEVKIADIKRDSCYMLPRLDTNDFLPKSYNYEKYL